MGFPDGSVVKNLPFNAGDMSLIPQLRRSLGEGNSYPLQYSGLENSMKCTVHGLSKSNLHFFSFYIEKYIAFSISEKSLNFA